MMKKGLILSAFVPLLSTCTITPKDEIDAKNAKPEYSFSYSPVVERKVEKNCNIDFILQQFNLQINEVRTKQSKQDVINYHIGEKNDKISHVTSYEVNGSNFNIFTSHNVSYSPRCTGEVAYNGECKKSKEKINYNHIHSQEPHQTINIYMCGEFIAEIKHTNTQLHNVYSPETIATITTFEEN